MKLTNGNFNNTILVAPLDWGLGHSTRCIPIIKHLLILGYRVVIASEGAQAKLLAIEFPELSILPLPGYRISYSPLKRFFSFKIAMQLPKILKAISSERKWVAELMKKEKIAAIISDNRFGFYYPGIPSVFITHQLQVKAPFLWMEKLIMRLNYRYISRFAECWVPDDKGSINLAGNLSHPAKLPQVPVHYLGGLSRFKKKENLVVKYDLLIVISGPEPQRSLLENKIINSLKDYEGRVLMVRGLPGKEETLPNFKRVKIVNHLDAMQLENAFNESELIISRSGYTTVMDLLRLGKKSILIPTPGQTEQEYIARHLQAQQWCMYVSQDKFNLKSALAEAKKFQYLIPELNMEAYKKVVENFVKNLKD